jgi:SOS-response transcriptional repressor LexA
MTIHMAQMNKALEFIKSYTGDKGFSPSYVEIAAHIGCNSKSNIHRIVTSLEKRGRIKRIKHCSRALTVVDPTISENQNRDVALKFVAVASAILPQSTMELIWDRVAEEF